MEHELITADAPAQSESRLNEITFSLTIYYLIQFIGYIRLHVYLESDCDRIAFQKLSFYNFQNNRFVHPKTKDWINFFGKLPLALDRLEAVTSSSNFNSGITWRQIRKVVGLNLISVLAILPYCFHMQVGNLLSLISCSS